MKQIITFVATGSVAQEAHGLELLAVDSSGQVYFLGPNIAGGVDLWPSNRHTAKLDTEPDGFGGIRTNVTIFENGEKVGTTAVAT